MTNNQTNMQLNMFLYISSLMWGEHDMLLYYAVSSGCCLCLLSLYTEFTHRPLLVLEEKCLWTQRVCFPSMITQAHFKPISAAGDRVNLLLLPVPPSPILLATVILVILSLCKLTTLVFGEPTGKERGGKWDENRKSFRVNTKTRQTKLTFNL